MGLDKILNLAIAQAHQSKGVGHNKNYRVGAVIFNKHKCLVAEYNTYKTHPIVLNFSDYPYLHAEMNCLVHLGLDNSEGCDIMVARIRKDGSLAMAKPCPECEEALRLSGIRRVHYTTSEGKCQCFSL